MVQVSYPNWNRRDIICRRNWKVSRLHFHYCWYPETDFCFSRGSVSLKLKIKQSGSILNQYGSSGSLFGPCYFSPDRPIKWLALLLYCGQVMVSRRWAYLWKISKPICHGLFYWYLLMAASYLVPDSSGEQQVIQLLIHGVVRNNVSGWSGLENRLCRGDHEYT